MGVGDEFGPAQDGAGVPVRHDAGGEEEEDDGGEPEGDGEVAAGAAGSRGGVRHRGFVSLGGIGTVGAKQILYPPGRPTRYSHTSPAASNTGPSTQTRL